MRTKFILTLLIIFSFQIKAQENFNKCMTTPLVEKELINNPDYAKGRANAISQNTAWIKANSSAKETINIPVVVHVIHKSIYTQIGQGNNISNEQIEDAIRVLNEDYSKTNPEFPNPPRSTFVNYAGTANMKFCLATTDPDGNPTNGITRTPTTKNSFDADTEGDDMKQNSTSGKDAWTPSKYLNIWVCNLTNSGGGGMTLGYAYLPGLTGWQVWKDGLVIDFQYFGTIDAASSSSDGRTATHEIGHYLGLNHTFSESNWPSYTCLDAQGNAQCCDRDEGNVDDTPATDGIYWGSVNSSTNNNTCNDLSYSNVFNTDVLDMDENFMAYSTNSWMFTTDQVNVMNATLNGYRLSLKNSTVSMNCTGSIGTGINNYQLENLHIYPNPTLGKLNITSADKINSLSITNIIGKQILFTENFTANTIDISSFENGVYFININTDKGTHIEKIILTK